jgi:hypothetical protein
MTGLAALMTADIDFGLIDGDSEPQKTTGRDETLVLLKSLVTGARTAHQAHTPEIGSATQTCGSSHRWWG